MKFIFALVAVSISSGTVFAACPLTSGDSLISNFVQYVAQRPQTESLKDSLKECSKSSLKDAKAAFESATLGARLESVNWYSSGELNISTNGEKAAKNINILVVGQVSLGLIEKELSKR